MNRGRKFQTARLLLAYIIIPMVTTARISRVVVLRGPRILFRLSGNFIGFLIDAWDQALGIPDPLKPRKSGFRRYY
jgi:hypothetical protein